MGSFIISKINYIQLLWVLVLHAKQLPIVYVCIKLINICAAPLTIYMYYIRVHDAQIIRSPNAFVREHGARSRTL